MSATAEKDIEFELLDHQMQFVNSDSRYVINSGGVGSGKTYSIVLKTLQLCLTYPGIFILIGAQTFPLLRDTTMREFISVVPTELIRVHNKTRSHFILHNGSEVLFRPLDDPNKIKSYNLGAAAIEELTDVSEDIFKMIRTRMRQPGMPGQVYGATNPGGFTNWVYKSFINKETRIADSEVVFSKSVDNDYLPAEYLTDLETLKKSNPEYYARMILGQWGNLEGLVYALPYSQRIDRKDLPAEFKKVTAGLDFGFNHPSSLVVVGQLDNIHYVIDEMYEYKLASSDIIERVRKKVDQYNIEIIYCDSARPEIIFDMQKAGLPARPCIKGPGSVNDGVQFVRGIIGQERLFVVNDCKFTLREFDSYIFDSEKDRPLDINNHSMDALRYNLHTGRKEIDRTLKQLRWT